MTEYIDLIIFLLLLIVGYSVGRIAERRHYRSILKREKEMREILIFSNRFPPLSSRDAQELVTGSVVISEDYFKRVISGLQSIIGGRLRGYESLLDRARREAVLRMKQEARDRRGAHDRQCQISDLFNSRPQPQQLWCRGSHGLWHGLDTKQSLQGGSAES